MNQSNRPVNQHEFKYTAELSYVRMTGSESFITEIERMEERYV